MPDGMHALLGKRHDLIFASDSPLSGILDQVERVAVSDATVLLTGETGTGKEVIARTLHKVRMKAKGGSGSFVPVNCGAIPENLIEAELFGHARGAFTGAHAARKGRVAMAEGGTLFLDEIGELPLALQVKLLRLLQERTYEPVGESRTLKATFRLVAATNRDLATEVAAGRFRSDLFYRLFVCPIELPPLRERPTDVPLLISHFWQARGETRSFDPQVMQILQAYTWPGNIRELENLVERVSVCAIDAIIRPSDLPPHIRQAESPLSTSNLAPNPMQPMAAPPGNVPQLPWLQSTSPSPTPPMGNPAFTPSAPFPANAFAGEQGWNAASASPVQASPVQASPVQASPVQASPVQASPVQASPVQASPVVDESPLPYAANEDGERRAALVQTPPMAFSPSVFPVADGFAPPQWTTSEAPGVVSEIPNAPPANATQTQQVLAGVAFPSELPCDLPALLRQLEWAFIDEALKQTGGNKQGAANLLGLRRTTLVEKLRRKKAAQKQGEEVS